MTAISHPGSDAHTPTPSAQLDLRSLPPGTRVRVTQQIVRQGGPEDQPARRMGVGTGEGTFTGVIEGAVVRFTQQKTGSWFAHSRDGKLWLDRLELRKPDGELIVLNIDQYTRVEVVR